jgi:hypothetical protein
MEAQAGTVIGGSTARIRPTPRSSSAQLEEWLTPYTPEEEQEVVKAAERTRLRMNIALIIIDTLRADHADPLYHEAQNKAGPPPRP